MTLNKTARGGCAVLCFTVCGPYLFKSACMGDLKNKRRSVRAVGGFPGEESKIGKQRVHIKQISKVFPDFLCEGTVPQKVKLVLIVVVA